MMTDKTILDVYEYKDRIEGKKKMRNYNLYNNY